jgi:hypothetical protein
MVSIFVLFKLCVSIVKEQKKELMLSNDKLKNRDLTSLTSKQVIDQSHVWL